MGSSTRNFPIGHSNQTRETIVKSSADVGNAVRNQRKQLKLKQLDIAGLGNTGNRFVIDLERGKPTVQLQKVMDMLDLLGLEIVIRPKGQPAL